MEQYDYELAGEYYEDGMVSEPPNTATRYHAAGTISRGCFFTRRRRSWGRGGGMGGAFLVCFLFGRESRMPVGLFITCVPSPLPTHGETRGGGRVQLRDDVGNHRAVEQRAPSDVRDTNLHG